jgi:hypothetical protein
VRDTALPDPSAPELRLALGMRGGVSLAVWIGGASGEIDELRRGEGFWGELTRAVGFSRVVVDVMAGASAGGLNAVLFGASIRNGFPMKGLGPIWNEVASVDQLRRTEAPWLSLFNGDVSFLRVIRDELAQQVPPDPVHPEGREPGLVDVQLSATLVEPLRVMAPSPADERLSRTRSSARFHFRHDSVTGVDRRDFDATPTNLARLALGARSTSSFPAAFEPALVRSTRPAAFGEPEPEVGPEPDLVDCRGVFSESGAPGFVVADGGIVDNIPLGKALEAVAAAPATGPTRRVLVYLHPSGPSPMPPSPTAAGADGEPDRRRRLRAVAAGAKAAVIQEESIDGDLERLEFLNGAARMARVMRAATSACFATDLRAGAASQWPTYRILRPGADAAQLRAVLDDPVVALGEDPFPLGLEDEGQWRAPLCYWRPEQRTSLDGDLTVALRERLTGDAPGEALLAVGISPLRRAVDLLLEWTRALSRWGCDTGTLKADLYRVRSVVNVAERFRLHGWVVRAASGLDGSVADWCTESLELLDGLLVSEPGAFDDLDAYRASVARRLQQLLEEGRVDPVAGADLRAEAVRELARLVEGSCRVVADPPPDDPALLLHQVLTTEPGRWPAADRIAALEVLCLPEFLAGRPGAEELRLVRISAAADTPVAAAFPQLVNGTRAIDERHEAERRWDGWEGRVDFLRPEVKLAGNELSNFSAFLDARWRDNDWMWGRLDTVSGLVEILLGHLRPDQVTDELRRCAGGAPEEDSLDDLRRRLVRMRQEEVLRERWGEGWEATAGAYDVGLETVDDPGSPEIRDSLVQLTAVASRVVGEELPGPLRGVASVLGHVAKYVVRRLAKPKGEVEPDGRRVRSVRQAPAPRPPGAGKPGSSLGLRTLLWLVPLAVAAVIWAIAWAVEGDPASLVIGIVCGLFVGLAALVFLVVIVLWDHPPRPRSRPG